MTYDKFGKNIDKDFGVVNIDDLLLKFVDANGICKTCGHNHRFSPSFKYTKTMISSLSCLWYQVISGNNDGIFS
jgi:hypothetical protein